jgi:hypothetical protein
MADALPRREACKGTAVELDDAPFRGSVRAPPPPVVDGATLHAAAEAYAAKLATVSASYLPRRDAAPPATAAVRAAVVIRPVLRDEHATLGTALVGRTAASHAQHEYVACLAEPPPSRWVHLLSETRCRGYPTSEVQSQLFEADAVFGPCASSAEVFEGAVRPLADRVLGGREACLVCFGQTGAGKTYTSTAMQRAAVGYLLEHAPRLRIAFFEVYGESCRDLMCSEPGATVTVSEATAADAKADADANAEGEVEVEAEARAEAEAEAEARAEAEAGAEAEARAEAEVAVSATLELREAANGELHVIGLREHEVSSVVAAEALLHDANCTRRTAATASNARSSRSHAICVLTPLTLLPPPPELPPVPSPPAAPLPPAPASLLLVDLAGSERREDITATMARTVGRAAQALLNETRATNLALATLKDCVRLQRAADAAHTSEAGAAADAGSASIASGAPRTSTIHVPYRRSKLTRILKPYLEGCVADEKAEAEAEAEAAAAARRAPSPRCLFLAHVHPLRSQAKHTTNTLEFVASLFGQSRASQERAAFNAVEAWSAAKVVRWVATLEGGRYAPLAPCFGGLSGKRLATEWRGTIIKTVRAQGGTEDDALAIYDAFHVELRRAAAIAKKGASKTPGQEVEEPH